MVKMPEALQKEKHTGSFTNGTYRKLFHDGIIILEWYVTALNQKNIFSGDGSLCGGEKNGKLVMEVCVQWDRDGRNVQILHPYRKSLSRPYIDKVHLKVTNILYFSAFNFDDPPFAVLGSVVSLNEKADPNLEQDQPVEGR